MPRVPEYRPDISPRPAYRENLAPVATPEAFGAAVGRGMSQLAAGIGQMSEAARAVQALEDEARVRDARNRFIQEDDQLAFDPETGYFNAKGKNALDQHKQWLDARRKLKEKYANELSPNQKNLFERATETLDLDRQRQGLIHRSSELKSYVVEGGKAAAENFAQEALRHVGNPAMVDKYMAAGLNELRNLGRLQGLPPDQQEALERDYVSGLNYKLAMTMAETDPIGADKFVRENSGRLTPDHAHDLRVKLKPVVEDAKGQQYAQKWLERTQKAAARPDKIVKMVNQGATRRQPITATLQTRLADAVVNVYGPGYHVEVYSGGQPAPGKGPRTGSTRHDHGRAADVRVIGPDGKQVSGDALAPLAQYWVAKNYGGVGLEMRGGGIHLDEHTDRARSWNYAKQGGRFTAAQARAIAAGLRGELPPLMAQDGAARAATGDGDDPSAVASPDSGQDLASFINSLPESPGVRDAALKHISSMMRLQAQAQSAEAENLKAQAFAMIEQGASPDDLPLDWRVRLGRSEMDGLWSYHNKMASGAHVVTDERVLSDLLNMYAEDKLAFAKIDPWVYKDKLSGDDWRKIDEMRRTAQSDLNKGPDLSRAFRMADQQLAGIGLTTAGVKDAKRREQIEAQRAQFQNELFREVEKFHSDPANKGRAPNDVEINQMIARLLLPITLRKEGMLWDSTEDGFLFQSPYRERSQTAEFNLEKVHVPPDVRATIEVVLESELQRKPTDEEVTRRYLSFYLNLPPEAVKP